MLGNGVFDEKLQDPWALLLRLSLFRKRNYRTLVQSNSAHLFFDETLQFHHFSIKPSCSFLERTVWIDIFFNLWKDLVVAWLPQTFSLKKTKFTIR